jgi:hypothetical protein
VFIHSLHDLPCIRVKEIYRPEIYDEPGTSDQQGYFAFRFAPVQKKQTDISVFTALLNPTKVKEPV